MLVLFTMSLAAVPASARFNYNVDVYVNGEYVRFPDQRPFIGTQTKQEQKNWSPIRIALWEGGDVYRSREASRLLDLPPVFEV